MNMTGQMQIVKKMAIEAGSHLLRAFHQNIPVRWKGAGNPVTDADSNASSFLVAELRKHFPGDGILSEEEADDRTRLNKSRVWFIDPMDGTSEFVAQIGEFAVMIGLAIDGIPTLGVVYQPTKGKLFYGSSGSGAFVEQEGVVSPLQVTANSDPSEVIATISRSHDSVECQSIRAALGIHRLIRSGSAGLKIGMICQGLADLYIHPGPETNLWDTCAPDAILREAGGRITDMFNAPLRYNVADPGHRQGVLATNGLIHERVVEAAERVARSRFV